MRHTENRRQLHIELETKDCALPADELPRLDRLLEEIATAMDGLPATLHIQIIYHEGSDRHHVEAALKLPRRTLTTGDWDTYLDTALQRSLRKLLHKIETYRREPDREADQIARRVADLNRELIAPEDPADGPLGAAVAEQDYPRFRDLLANYEDWLRLRIGRWLQRYPEIEAQLGDRLRLGDIVEEVFLNAFEYYHQRPKNSRVRTWLEALIDPSLRALWNYPLEERESISHARSLREMRSA